MATTTLSNSNEQRTTLLVSAVISDLMAEGGITQTQLGVRLGLSQSNISRRMSGTVAWSVDEIDCAARVFGVHPLALLALLPQKDSNLQPAGKRFAEAAPYPAYGMSRRLAVAA